VQREMRPPKRPTFGADHMLPSAAREKAMVLARDQLGPVLERDAVCGLDARPLVEHASDREAPIDARADGPVDLGSDLEVREPLGASVGEENPRVTRAAIAARVTAAAVRVDRPAKRHTRLLGNPVEDRSSAHLIKT